MLCAHIIDTNMTMCVSDHLKNPSGTRYIKNAANVSRRVHWKSDTNGRTVDNSYSFSETRHVVVVVVPSTLCYSSREKLITRERAETVRNHSEWKLGGVTISVLIIIFTVIFVACRRYYNIVLFDPLLNPQPPFHDSRLIGENVRPYPGCGITSDQGKWLIFYRY